MDDKKIKHALIHHDERIYLEIIDTYSKLLWAIAYSILGKNSSFRTMDAEEIVSDVFIRLWREPEKFNSEKGSLKNYLALMTKSLALNRCKQKKRDEAVELFDNYPEIVETEYDWGDLYNAIQQLEEPYKEIIVRRFLLSEKPKDIRKKLKISVKQFDNYLYRGKKKLKQIFLDKLKNGGR